jgi:uncharacterized coiled-coil protein SlyX
MFRAEKRLLELETALERSNIKVEALETAWRQAQIDLADISEKVLNTLKRLQARDRRNGPTVDEPTPEKKPISPAAQRLLGMTS